VIGSEIPESTNSALFRLAELIVTDAPLAVRLPFSAALAPTCTLPKLRLVGDTANVPEAVPVPERPMLSGEFEAFETMERLPLTAPALAGVKVTLKVTLWLGLRVRGRDKPLTANAAPVTFACEIVTLDPPVLVTVSDKLELLPTCTLPNASEVGFAERAPGVTPVPESGMVNVGFDPFEVMVTFPLTAPLALGAKTTVNEVL